MALAYAANHADRIERIILWSGYANAGDSSLLPRIKAVQSLFAQDDWELYTETLAQVLFGLAGGEPARQYAAYMRDCVTREEAAAYFAADQYQDVTSLLREVAAPTLLLHPSNAPLIAPVAWGRALASAMPQAQLRLFDTSLIWSDEIEDWIVGSIRDFLPVSTDLLPDDSADTNKVVRKGQEPSVTAIVLFTDIADSTALTEQMGDTAFRAASRELDGVMRAAISDSDGTPVDGKVLGDGVMATFTSATRAIEAAGRCVALGAERRLSLHVGIHAGDVIPETGNVYGGTVNIAARVCGASAPDEILVSATIRELARTSANVTFDDRGEHALKGIEGAMRLFAVRPRRQ